MRITIAAALVALSVAGVDALRAPEKYRRQSSPGSYINATHTNNTNYHLSIDTKDTSLRNDTAPYLYGLMFEDINVSMTRVTLERETDTV